MIGPFHGIGKIDTSQEGYFDTKVIGLFPWRKGHHGG